MGTPATPPLPRQRPTYEFPATMAPIADARAPLTDVRVGILGGGQLGRMLAQAASPLGLYTAVLDPAGDKASAADAAAAVVAGDFKKAEDIIRFVDAVRPHVLTVEIEHVNVDALEAVQRERGTARTHAL